MGFVVVSPRYEPARKRICIVISSAQNLRASERTSVFCFRRMMIIFPLALFTHACMRVSRCILGHRYIPVSFRARYQELCSSLIAAGRLFPAHETEISCAIPAFDRNVYSSQTYYSELKGCIHSQKRIESDFNIKRNCDRFISAFKY